MRRVLPLILLMISLVASEAATSSDTYGGDPNGCNNCHTMCASNDYICSPKLQLASF